MPKANNEMDDTGHIHALYAAAHHDIWWAKSALWTATQWSLGLQAVVVGAAGTSSDLPAPQPANVRGFVVMSVVIAILTLWYQARMHADVIRNRFNADFIRARDSQMDAVYGRLLKTGDAASHTYRGLRFVIFLMVMAASALALSEYILVGKLLNAMILGLVACIVGAGLLWHATVSGSKGGPELLQTVSEGGRSRE